MELKYMREMSPEEVYGYHWSVPAGHEAIGFYPPKRGDLFLNAGDYSASECTADYNQDEPRLILRKNAKKRVLVRRFEIVEGADFGFSGQSGGKYDGISAGNLARAFPDRYSIVEEEC